MDQNIMSSNRTNLEEIKQNSTYIILTIILVVLSIVGVVLFFQILKTRSTSTEITPQPTTIPTITSIVTPTLAATNSAAVVASPSSSLTATPTKKPTPTLKPTATLKPTNTPKPTSTPRPTATPTLVPTLKSTSTPKPTSTPTLTPTQQPTSTGLTNYENQKDGFSLSYNSSRKLFTDTESSGNRYTFILSSGNFAVHVGTNNWAWVYPNREFNTNLTISGQPTFRYDIDTQTIVDIEYNNKKYTLQCIHNNIQSLKDECEKFIQSFKFL